jgi:hypothetical protein
MGMGGDLTGPAEIEVVRRPNPRRRRRVVGIVAGVLLLVAAATGWVLVADPFNPYRPGTAHASLVHEQPWCADRWGVTLLSGVHHYHWGRGSAPAQWDPGPVSGTLTILHDWGSTGTDAIFESDGQQVDLTGGSPGGTHVDDLSCAVK